MKKLKIVLTNYSYNKDWKWIFVVSTFIFAFYACRKQSFENLFDENNIETKFFTYPSTLDTNIKEFANEIARQNSQSHFLKYFIDNNGYPKWEDFEKENIGGNVVAVIPFSMEAMNEINGFIVCRKNIENKFNFTLYKKDSINSYGFEPLKRDSLNAKQVQVILNALNFKHFGITTSHINDKRMLPDSILKKYPQNTDPSKLVGYLKNNKGNTNEPSVNLYQTCITYTVETDWWWSPSGSYYEGEPGSYYAYSTFSYETVCVDGGSGGTTYGGTTQNTNWWTGSGGGGGGITPPPIVRDSTYFKGLLNKYVLAIGHISDSVFNLAQTQLVEWSFVITEKDGNVYVRNIKTDTLMSEVNLKYFPIPSGETLKGGLHTHQDSGFATAFKMKCSIDMWDVFELGSFNHMGKQDYVSIVEIGDLRQAYVIEDPVKAIAFVQNMSVHFWDNYQDSVAASPMHDTNYRQATLNVTLNQLDSSSVTGIGVYQTIDPAKTQFIKLN